ncbi:metallophosphoesterase domain-containing protein 1 [Rhizophlyctis rosea]|uniref:Metallophosphoesterase domain-containing protein 1 n=1 Tax=Rhizophlyctis rosea TaxID=64517 RepID=A0AAD5X1J8_9FUNG|nr:metallophosphoesterase domain-containing protein 1 [Rhizophlyctis rosea]
MIHTSFESQLPATAPPGHLRFVCISDTHSQHDKLTLPPGDVLLHSGDFSYHGEEQEVEKFVAWLKGLPYRWKIIIAGNHECIFHLDYFKKHQWLWSRAGNILTPEDALAYARKVRHILADTSLQESHGIVYLEDSGFEISEGGGIKVWGSPWQPEFCDWAFNLPTNSQALANQWSLIPPTTDILLTHGPPLSILDKSIRGDSCGCAQLSKRLLTTPPLDATGPKVHLFGHIHEAYGVVQKKGITFINGCSVNSKYKCVNRPVVFDFKAEEGDGMDVDL